MNAYITGNNELFIDHFNTGEFDLVGEIVKRRGIGGVAEYVLRYDSYTDTERVYLGRVYPTAEHAARQFAAYQFHG